MRRRCRFDADMVIAWLVVLELTLFAHVALSGSEHVVDVSASDQLPWLIPSLFLLWRVQRGLSWAVLIAFRLTPLIVAPLLVETPSTPLAGRRSSCSSSSAS